MRRNTPAFAMGEIGIGYLFLCISVKFLTLDLLPNWVGYLLILLAVRTLTSLAPSLNSLMPLGVVLGAWEGVLWLLVAFGKSDFSVLTLLNLMTNVLEIYFHFQLFTELAAISVRTGLSGQKIVPWMRTVCTILFTVTALPLVWEGPFSGAVRFACVVVGLWICAVLFGVCKRMETEVHDSF